MTEKSAYGGLFQDPPYLSSDKDPNKTDPYDKQDCIPSRYLGKNMSVGGHVPHGEFPDAYFDKKYLTLASADQNNGKPVGYNENYWKEEATQQRKTKPISDKDFRYSSHPQKSTGPGSYYGCIQSKPYEYMTEPWEDPKSKSKKKKAAAAPSKETEKTHLPNIKTAPTKKGTYGYPGLLLSNPAYNEKWKEEHAAAETREAKKTAATVRAAGPPLHLSGVSHAYLDELPNTGISAVYVSYTPPEDAAAEKRRKAAAAAPTNIVIHAKAFVGHANRSGDQGCITPFPNVWVSPEAMQLSKAVQRRQAEKEKAEAARRAKAPPVWKPNSGEKTSVVSSCLRRFY